MQAYPTPEGDVASDPFDLARFWSKVDLRTPNECWPWRGARDDGYGNFTFQGQPRRAHRIAYVLLRGLVPEGLVLDHLCRNRACCNPKHLEPVTHQENIRRGISPAASRAKQTHCKQGHEFTVQNTGRNPQSGTRVCLECKRARDRRAYHRRKAANQR